MTKKHFEAVAATIRTQMSEWSGNTTAQTAIEAVAHDLASTFEDFNAQFDRQRFLVACGVAQ